MSNDHGYSPLSKYSSARDSILHFLCEYGWAENSVGDVEAPTGYVWRISNTVEDTNVNNGEFNSVLEDWFIYNQEVTDSPALRAELVGHFLVQEDSNGLVHVRQYPTESALLADFRTLEDDFSAWNDQEEA